MIKIEKRIIEVDIQQFKNELKKLAELNKKHNGSLIGISYKKINEIFKLKLQDMDFFELSEKLNLKVWRGQFWMIDDLINI